MEGCPQQKEVLSAFKTSSLHNRFLLTLISSSAFKTYFDMLVFYYKSSLLPTRQQMPIYHDFSKTFQQNPSAKTVKVAEARHDVQLAQEDEDEGDGKGDEGDEEGDEESDEEGDEEGDEEEEGDPSSFFKFVKTLVVHFTAKRALETHCLRLTDQEVDATLFYVERSRLVIPTGSWLTMKAMMEELFVSDPSPTTATKAFKILEGKVLDVKVKPKLQKLLAGFRCIINDKRILLSGGMHCETVLATLGKYFEPFLQTDQRGNNGDLITLCKVLLLFTFLLVLSEHLSLESTSIAYDICVETMLSSVLDNIRHIE